MSMTTLVCLLCTLIEYAMYSSDQEMGLFAITFILIHVFVAIESLPECSKVSVFT